MRVKNLLLGLLIAALGIIVIIKPSLFVVAAVLIIGLFAVVSGILSLVELRKIEGNSAYKKTVVIKSLISLIIGLIALFSPLFLLKTVNTIWTIMAYVLAVYLVIYSVTGFIAVSILSSESEDFSEIKKRKTGESLLCLLIAVLLFIIPIPAVIDAVLRIAGSVAAVIGFCISGFEVFKIVQTKKSDNDVIEVEAEVVDAPSDN